MKRIAIAFAAIMLVANAAMAQEEKQPVVNLMGFVRAGYELDATSGYGRFQVSNANVYLMGNVTPAFSYFGNVNFCDRGSLRVLDAYASFRFNDHFKLSGGQQLIPYSVDAWISPQTQMYASRSYIFNQVGLTRGVGATLRYDAGSLPVYVEAGAFNAGLMTDHNVWEKRELTYSAKIGCKAGNVDAEISMESQYPDSVRINFVNAAISYSLNRWLWQAEYSHAHYAGQPAGALRGSDAYMVSGCYTMPIKLGVLNQLSVQGRFDGMTQASNRMRAGNGVLVANFPERKRATLGATLGYKQKMVWCDFRLNYEMCFYKKGAPGSPDNESKLIAEIYIMF